MAEQVANAGTGSGNVVIQIAGDGNTVEFGRPHLCLTLHAVRSQRVAADIDRLVPFARAVPLIGRDEELADLRAFLAGPAAIAVRVLIGEAGAGKTRLALELCRDAQQRGWEAGFATAREMQRFLAQQNLVDWGWRKPTLIVVDYAAALADALQAWLGELADHAGDESRPLRLLLLERHADTEVGWWAKVFGGADSASLGVPALLDPPYPQLLKPLVGLEHRLCLLRAAFAQFGGSEAALPDDLAARVMDGDWGAHPLLLQMAALQMARHGVESLPGMGRAELCLRMAQHELDRVAALARSEQVDESLARHLAACVTLAEGMERDTFLRFASSEKQAIGLPSGGDPARLARCLAEAVAAEDGSLAPVLPDLVGEATILAAFDRRDIDGAAAVQRCFDVAGLPVARSLIRTCQDYGRERAAPVRWLQRLFDRLMPAQLETARQIVQSLPDKSIALASFATTATQRLSDELSKGKVLEVEGERLTMLDGDHAYQLYNLSNRLSDEGRHEEALQASTRAETFFRETIALLAEQAAKRPRPSWWRMQRDLAKAIGRRAACHGALGETRQELALTQEALSVYRAIPPQARSWPKSEAMLLHNQGTALIRAGLESDGVAALREALALLREAPADDAEEHAEMLASSLLSLSVALRSVGQVQESLDCVDEAVGILRPMAEAQPDAHLPELADALVKRSVRHGELEQPELALQDIDEAVLHYRQLAHDHERTFGPALARALGLCCERASEAQQWQQAVSAIGESVALHRELAAAGSPARVAAFAHALLKQATTLSCLQQWDAAREASDEAIAVFRSLPPEPGGRAPHVIRALATRAQMEMLAQQPAQALPFWEEAIRTQAPFLQAGDGSYLQLQRMFVRDYVDACAQAETAPDMELLGPQMPLLNAEGGNND